MENQPLTSSGIRQEAEQAARRFRLPFSRQAWKGVQGNWTGQGAGNSIDFQDHRAYQWGDDPRGIHWAAYARTGQLTMKIYRAELSPLVDIAVDVSESMLLHENRAAGTEALLQFCMLSSMQAGAQVRMHAVKGRRTMPLETEDVHSGRWLGRAAELPADETMPVPGIWRANGLKIIITDLLYPGEPGALLSPMASRGGLSLILVPTLPEEAALPETGNVRLKNCESGAIRHQYVSPSLARRYARAYAAHFELWAAACRRHEVLFSRIPCDRPLPKALAGEALNQGAVELA